MVAADKILEAARKHGADMIGLSGLITPSLDEMVFVAQEMERQGFDVPLLIGGATTSAQHTAVKIAPNYTHPVLHVHDASRSVGVVSDLLDDERRAKLDEANRDKQGRMRDSWKMRQEKPLLSHERALQNRHAVEWRAEDVTAPPFTGRRVVDDVSIADLAPFIDWTMFFVAWEMKGKFPRILDDPEQGPAARELYENAQELLQRMIADGALQARAVYGFWPAHAVGEDVVLYADDARGSEAARFPMLRQQQVHPDDRPNRSLADLVAPPESGLADHVGLFAVTIHGADELAERYKADRDDYNAIIVKVLADRLAEAFAEYLHARARREWGHEDASVTPEQMLHEDFRGIRPAFGYPACPDHSQHQVHFDLLDASEIGAGLTDHMAMTPAASVAGFYFGHPEARYFGVGRIDRDQVEDYSRRAGMEQSAAERWLRPWLAYEPEE